MPITPFNFGPGALFKTAAPRHVSRTAFALANGFIDLESILLFFLTGEPVHRFFHTLLGATLVALAAGVCKRLSGKKDEDWNLPGKVIDGRPRFAKPSLDDGK